MNIWCCVLSQSAVRMQWPHDAVVLPPSGATRSCSRRRVGARGGRRRDGSAPAGELRIDERGGGGRGAGVLMGVADLTPYMSQEGQQGAVTAARSIRAERGSVRRRIVLDLNSRLQVRPLVSHNEDLNSLSGHGCWWRRVSSWGLTGDTTHYVSFFLPQLSTHHNLRARGLP